MTEEQQRPAPGRGRAAIALGAAALLAALVVVAAVTGSSGSPADETPDDCLEAWNSSATALADGAHAYGAHDYRAALVTRVDDDGALLAADAEGGRCAVVFAGESPDREPDFGARVHQVGRWTSLLQSEGLTVERVTAMQRQASADANATVLPDGSLSAGR